MVYIKHPNHPDGQFRMEDNLYENLKVLPKRIEKDSDVLALFVGSPGVGKDTLMQQCLYVLDSEITIDSVSWTFEDYVRYSLTLFEAGKSKGRGIMHSEGRESLSGLSMMTKRTRDFLNFLYENRQMNLIQFIATGDFFDVPKSIVMQRARFLIEVHEGNEFDKGFFKFYDAPSMRRLYIFGKKERNMGKVGAIFNGRFPKFYTIDEDAYRKKKKDMLIMNTSRYLKDNADKDKEITMREWLYFLWSIAPNVPAHVIINNTPISSSYYFKCKKEWELNAGELVAEG